MSYRTVEILFIDVRAAKPYARVVDQEQTRLYLISDDAIGDPEPIEATLMPGAMIEMMIVNEHIEEIVNPNPKVSGIACDAWRRRPELIGPTTLDEIAFEARDRCYFVDSPGWDGLIGPVVDDATGVYEMSMNAGVLYMHWRAHPTDRLQGIRLIGRVLRVPRMPATVASGLVGLSVRHLIAAPCLTGREIMESIEEDADDEAFSLVTLRDRQLPLDAILTIKGERDEHSTVRDRAA